MAGPKLDATTHDYELDDMGQPTWIGGDISDQPDYATMIAQRIKCRLWLLRGEWYLDQRVGTPWKQRIWRKGANAETLRHVLTNVITGTPGVRQLVSLDIDYTPETRSATVAFQVLADMHLPVSSGMLDEPFIIRIPEGPNG